MPKKKIVIPSKSIWEKQKAKLRLAFPKLTEADVEFDQTRKEEMLKSLEYKLAIPAEELQVMIETL